MKVVALISRSSGAYEVTKENEPPSKVKKLAKKRQSGINTEWKNEFPWLEDLNDDCERGFSTLRRVKTELRSNLSDPILNCLLAVSLEGESVADFNIINCVDMWADVKKRRINLT